MVNLRNYSNAATRRAALAKQLKVELDHIGKSTLNEKTATTRNIENMVGAVQIPLGVAGPLTINHSPSAISSYYLPLATTEGALVASVNRGAKAITLSGGTQTISKRVGITRAPVFTVENLAAGQKLTAWVGKNFKELKKITEATSSHLTLLEIKPWQVGRSVYLRFRFDAEDAMGMNMATIAATAAVTLIEEKTDAKCIAVSGNMCVDKKANLLNFIEGRGISASAEAIISSKILKDILKTNAEEIMEVYQRKIVYGSMLSGTIGANAQAANVLAALFTATGQDIAHIVEAASAVTTVEKLSDDNIYISVSLPDLPVGTVGGGTMLETQLEALSILGISGGNNGKNAQKLAEIIAGAVLAGELSLLASLAENSLACAHRKLGRGENI